MVLPPNFKWCAHQTSNGAPTKLQMVLSPNLNGAPANHESGSFASCMWTSTSHEQLAAPPAAVGMRANMGIPN